MPVVMPAGAVQQLRLAQRPAAELQPGDFYLHSVPAPTASQLQPGQLLLRPCYISVDPYMRTRMQASGYDYIEHWQAGSVLSGWTLAQVEASADPQWQAGDWAIGHLPMQQRLIAAAATLWQQRTETPPLDCMHPLGMTGFTAWLGMQLGQPGPDDTVLVCAAAGAVGSLAAQLARQAGARVIVAAGREDKRQWLRQAGFTEVLDHHHRDFLTTLAQHAPQGISLNFELIGGQVFHGVNELMREGGRVVLCGLISQYQRAQPRQAPANLAQLQRRRVQVLPYVAPHYEQRLPAFRQAMPALLDTLHWQLDVLEGSLDTVPAALIGLLRGDNLGKRLVRLV
ncbi:NADP-dependent oxidoreductase [Pokkaliibacter sp. MBI-7]|uniref:NADP-dependent oxidoreductase n=1 Tax=Pokkaliibacter sp. MBI-7 TaxID=3040600 RepID=UPI00244D4609|nr:NADP-dependent oxidoreductase [Pokkaliibacter sp. MBI-7]MDH2433400.1 NADP-dependent oxidoreductase [Pokkaliibacter sp. MBI-7]